MPQPQKTKKQRFEAGHAFQAPNVPGEKLKLMEDRGREYVSAYVQNQWNMLAFIDVVTDTHLMLSNPGADPVIIAFDKMTFDEP